MGDNSSGNDNNEAIMFFSAGDVCKEMTYPEFAAVLDCVVPVEDFNTQRVRAVYLRIDSRLLITAAVFFYIAFDAEGYADKNWDMPLQRLADSAGVGPNLGAGAIALCCRRQCSISAHQRGLWDPDTETSPSPFELMRDKALRNRLGLLLPGVDEGNDQGLYAWSDSGGSEDPEIFSSKQYTSQLVALRAEQRLRITTIKAEVQAHLRALRQHYLGQLQESDRLLQVSHQLFSEEKNKNKQLRSELELQNEDVERLGQQYRQALDSSAIASGDSLGSLEETYGVERRQKIAAATLAVEEEVRSKDVELFYRDEKIRRLMAEISALRGDEYTQSSDESSDESSRGQGIVGVEPE